MRSKTLLIVTLTGLALAGTSLVSQARMKCWTDKNGNTACGDSVPPEYSQKGHKEYNERGLVIEEQERAKTEEELKEAARQAAIEEEKRRQKEEQKKQDQMLLNIYSNVEDIKLVRDERLAALESNIKVTQKRNEAIKEDLDKRIADAAAAERAGKKPSEALLDDIESLKRQIRNNESFIKERRREMEDTREEYAAKIERFKELKGIDS